MGMRCSRAVMAFVCHDRQPRRRRSHQVFRTGYVEPRSTADSSWSTTAAWRWRPRRSHCISAVRRPNCRETTDFDLCSKTLPPCARRPRSGMLLAKPQDRKRDHAGRCTHGSKSEHTEQKRKGIGELVQCRRRKFWPRRLELFGCANSSLDQNVLDAAIERNCPPLSTAFHTSPNTSTFWGRYRDCN